LPAAVGTLKSDCHSLRVSVAISLPNSFWSPTGILPLVSPCSSQHFVNLIRGIASEDHQAEAVTMRP